MVAKVNTERHELESVEQIRVRIAYLILQTYGICHSAMGANCAKASSSSYGLRRSESHAIDDGKDGNLQHNFRTGDGSYRNTNYDCLSPRSNPMRHPNGSSDVNSSPDSCRDSKMSAKHLKKYGMIGESSEIGSSREKIMPMSASDDTCTCDVSPQPNDRIACNDVLYPDTRRPGPPTSSSYSQANVSIGAISREITPKRDVHTMWTMQISKMPNKDTLFSQPFELPARVNSKRNGSDSSSEEYITWQMMIKPFDFTGDTVSVYLHCSSLEQSKYGNIAVTAKFSFVVSSKNKTRQYTASDSKTNSNIVVQHTFTGEEISWGIQEFINMEDVGLFLERKEGGNHENAICRSEISVKLVMHECRVHRRLYKSNSTNSLESVRIDEKDETREDSSSKLNMHKKKLKCQGEINDLEKTAEEALSLELSEKINGLYLSSLTPVLLSDSPRIIVVDNFLTKAECDNLVKIAKPDLRRSRVASGLEIEGRTSHGTFLTGRKEKDRTVMAIEKKIAEFMNSNWVRQLYDWEKHPLMRAEAMQVVKYEVGQFYHEHYDNKAGQTSMRAATFMIYLSDSEGGGATYFPRAVPIDLPSSCDQGAMTDKFAYSSSGDSCSCSMSSSSPSSPSVSPTWSPTSSDGECQDCGNQCRIPSLVWGADRVYESDDPGIRIIPKKGRTVLFWSKKRDGCEDLNSIHAAETVTRGEKWIATRWLSEKQ